MNQLDRLILKAHQSLVDLTQKEPIWWGEQVSIIMMICAALLLGCLHHSILGIFAYTLQLGFTVYAFIKCAGKDREWFAFFGDVNFIRIGLLFLTMYNLLSIPLDVWVDKFTLEDVPDDVLGACLTSFYYFSMCRPPAPPKRREKLVFSFQQ